MAAEELPPEKKQKETKQKINNLGVDNEILSMDFLTKYYECAYFSRGVAKRIFSKDSLTK